MEKPILFSTEMVHALLDGKKTQTRRLVKMYKGDEHQLRQNSNWLFENKTCPYGKKGDLLWVRETFKKSEFTLNGFTYKANAHPEMPNKGWKPSIYMPKSAARIWLKVTNVRVERLKDISKSSALAEGVFEIEKDEAYKDYMKQPGSYAGPIGSFFSLWESINGLDSLIADPWLWVIEFEVVSTTGRDNVKEVEA